MNPYFPDWQEANIAISDFLDYFDVYVYVNTKYTPKSISVFFLPPSIFTSDRIPNKERQLFVDIYNIYANWVTEEINLHYVFDKYMYQTMEETTLSALKKDIRDAIYDYDANHMVSLREALGMQLGVNIK